MLYYLADLIVEPVTKLNICTHIVIWADKYIGRPNSYEKLISMFWQTTKFSFPPHTEDADTMARSYMINFHDVFEPIMTVDTIEGCIRLLKRYAEKHKIFLITSGSFGCELIPSISSEDWNIASVYVFCGNLGAHVEWAWDFTNIVQMFDHEDTLLCRLARDISRYYIQLGNTYRDLADHTSALTCFQYAKTLRLRADFMEPDSPTKAYSIEYIRELDTLICQCTRSN